MEGVIAKPGVVVNYLVFFLVVAFEGIVAPCSLENTQTGIYNLFSILLI